MEVQEYQEDQLIKSVLQNHLILQQLISHLSLSDLKSFRLVCSYWEKISKSAFIKSGVISVYNTDFVKRNLKSFLQDFPLSNDSTVFPFTNFRFSGRFVAENMETFFNDRPFIKELQLLNLNLTDSKLILLKTYDVSKWSGFRLSSLKIISRFSLKRTHYYVPLNFVGAIDSLSLNSATVILNERITPTSLNLNMVQFLHNGQESGFRDLIRLNDYIDLRNLRYFKFYPRTNGNVHLDVSSGLQLKKLALDKINVVGWNNDMTLKRLDIKSGVLPVSQLPPSVQELNIDFLCFGNHLFLRDSRNRQYPNLKSLCLHDNHVLSAHCPNLVRYFVKNPRYQCFSQLPQSVRVIVIEGSWRFFKQEAIVFQLDKLVFSKFPLFDLDSMVATIDWLRPKTVVLALKESYCYGARCDKCNGWIDRIYPVIQKQSENGGVFVLKTVNLIRNGDWCGCSGRPNSPLFHIKHDYFMWKGEFGKAIDQTEFDQWVNNY